MRRLLLILMAMLIAGCGGQAAAPPAALSAPWGDGDRLEYEIQRAGKTEGTSTFTTARQPDGYLITTEATLGAMKDMTRMRVDKNLKPVSGSRELTGAGNADFTLATTYSGGKLAIQAKTSGGDKSMTISVPADAWDNDQLLMTVRALPLAEKYATSVTTIVGASATAIKTDLKVVAKEQVTVPAGAFTAYKVELSFGQSKHYAWYDVQKPHYMIKYENVDVQRVFVLTKAGAP